MECCVVTIISCKYIFPALKNNINSVSNQIILTYLSDID